MNTYDDAVARYILRHLRDNDERPWDEPRLDHMADCDDTTVIDADASNGSYGCDTGCSYYTCSATLSCPHGEPAEFEFGDFGELPSMVKELETWG
jgi:hypothetical protein